MSQPNFVTEVRRTFWRSVIGLVAGLIVAFLVSVYWPEERAFLKWVVGGATSMLVLILMQVFFSLISVHSGLADRFGAIADILDVGKVGATLRAAGFSRNPHVVRSGEVGKEWMKFLFHVQSRVLTCNWLVPDGYEGFGEDSVAVHQAKYRAEGERADKLFIVENEQELYTVFRDMMCGYCRPTANRGTASESLTVRWLLKADADKIKAANKKLCGGLSLDFAVLPAESHDIVWENRLARKGRKATGATLTFDLDLARRYRSFFHLLSLNSRLVQNYADIRQCKAMPPAGSYCPRKTHGTVVGIVDCIDADRPVLNGTALRVMLSKTPLPNIVPVRTEITGPVKLPFRFSLTDVPAGTYFVCADSGFDALSADGFQLGTFVGFYPDVANPTPITVSIDHETPEISFAIREAAGNGEPKSQ